MSLTVDCKAHLCSPECLTIYFLRDLISGTRKYVKTESVKTTTVPYFKELGVKEFFDKLDQWPQVLEYLPEKRDQFRLPRQWIIDIYYTVVGEEFSRWVDKKILKRNEELAERQKLYITMDPEIAAAFYNSVNISTSTGSSAHLLKVGTKRRRSKAEIEDQLAKEDLEATIVKEQEEKIEYLEKKLVDSETNLERGASAYKVLQELVKRGYLKQDENGMVTPANATNVIGNAHEQNQ